VDLDFYENMERIQNPDMRLKKILKILFLLQNKYVPPSSSKKYWPFCLVFLKCYRKNLGNFINFITK